ncbi:MAG: SpoIIE family protein phosphatase [Clostridiales Family XIII bacterium]|jgi:sigma-B regulation protein RsbU (phosphoserine phosphatase)|nr:SpoIIE family protein phosphatase [Clostridiales Family XIII bacterium]
MVETLPIPIAALDETETIVYINRTMEATFGSLLGMPWTFLCGDAEGGDRNALSVLMRGERAGRAEAVLADVTYDMLFSSVTDDAGRRHTVVMLEDVSEKRYLESRLKQNVEKIKNETGVAKHIQNSILPIDDEYWKTVRISSIYLPADDLGGDVFDVVRLNEGETLFYIADVSGHGIQASLLTMFLREKVRAKKDVADRGLDALLREILTGFLALDIDAMFYLSILLCKYDKPRAELSIANAGHNCFPLVIRQGGRVEEIPVKGMPISRISDETDYEEEIIGMKPGDRVILYTDGLIEEYSKTEKRAFGSEGVRRVAERLFDREGQALAKAIVAEASAYAQGAAKDDRTIIVADLL